MLLFSLGHCKAAYITDFVLNGLAVCCLLIFLVIRAPYPHPLWMLILFVLGLFAFTGVEYFLHRFILHGVEPFKCWHATHHAHPSSMTGTPIILSVSLIIFLMFIPVLIFTNWLFAGTLALGLNAGYLFYAIIHHAIHHWQCKYDWLKRRKIWHARHYHTDVAPIFFGITTSFWDAIFRSDDLHRCIYKQAPNRDENSDRN
ncbi:sterol desaturase family protein [Undibacterium sp. SXout7W]|uniref:sterol desaturase family protein n=1 Tax=Undibacterium sp. SXout7W TaxID=3413049 RepID=UPI003BF2352B